VRWYAALLTSGSVSGEDPDLLYDLDADPRVDADASIEDRAQRGVVFLMLRSVTIEGRLGLIAIGADQADCDRLYAATQRLRARLSHEPRGAGAARLQLDTACRDLG
jgi:hypothetical protein